MGAASPTHTSNHVSDWAVILWTCPAIASCPLARRQRKAGIGRHHKEAGAAGTLAWLPVPLQHLPLQGPGLVSVPHPHPSPQACGSSCFLKCPFVSPPPAPHSVLTDPQEHVRQRRGSAAALPQLPRHSGRPSTDLSQEPRCAQMPLWGRTPLFFPASVWAAHPGFCSRVSGSPANFSITLSPPSPRTSPHFFQPSH